MGSWAGWLFIGIAVGILIDRYIVAFQNDRDR